MPNERFDDGVGGILVAVSTAIAALPVADASVTITRPTDGGEEPVRELKTNSSGKTEVVAVPTPLLSASETPGGEAPYARYNVTVRKERYGEVTLRGVQVFPMTVSILPVSLIPLPE